MSSEHWPAGLDFEGAELLARAIQHRRGARMTVSLYRAGDELDDTLRLSIDEWTANGGSATSCAQRGRMIETLSGETLVVAGHRPGTATVELEVASRTERVQASAVGAWIAILNDARMPFEARLRTFNHGGQLLQAELLDYADPPDLRGPIAKAQSVLSDRARALRAALGWGPRRHIDYP